MPELLEALVARPGLATGSALLIALAVTLLWEGQRPARRFADAPAVRVGANYGLLLANQAAGVVIVPLTGLIAALLGGTPTLAIGFWPSAMMALLVVDAVHWAVHWVQHQQALLWRVHAVHHSDAAFDSSLSFRFHPLEVVLVAAVTASAATLARLTPEGLMFAVVVSTAWTVLEHANARFPARLERMLTVVFITPDLHRLHHAETPARGACNYGTVLSVWDRVAGTLRLPSAGEPERFGLRDDPGQESLNLMRLLAAPFRRRAAA